MKVRVRKTQPRIDEARILEVVRASGIGITTRELCKKLGYDFTAASRALGQLNNEGLVRSSWVPNKSGNQAEPVQFACYTYVEQASDGPSSPLQAGTPQGERQPLQGGGS